MTRPVFLLLTVLSLCAPAVLPAQPHVDARNLNERIIVVVPIVGAGTYQDPKRPLFAPIPGPGAELLKSYQWEPSDDGRWAIVEFVARDAAALREGAKDSRVAKAFLKNASKAQDIEQEIRKYKKDFQLDKLDARRPK